jgi:hypothetical protein
LVCGTQDEYPQSDDLAREQRAATSQKTGVSV